MTTFHVLRVSFYVAVFLLAALVSHGCSGDCEGRDRGRPEPIEVPFVSGTDRAPVAAVYVLSGGMFTDEGTPAEQVSVIVAVWEDGEVIWSEDRLSGGPPYRRGTVDSPEDVARAAGKLSQFQFLSTARPKRTNIVVPDMPYQAILVRSPGGWGMGVSCHELIEARNSVLVTDHGTELLEGRQREAVLAQQPKWYRIFRREWSEARRIVSDLCPEESTGTPVKVNFEVKWVPIGS